MPSPDRAADRWCWVSRTLPTCGEVSRSFGQRPWGVASLRLRSSNTCRCHAGMGPSFAQGSLSLPPSHRSASVSVAPGATLPHHTDERRGGIRGGRAGFVAPAAPTDHLGRRPAAVTPFDDHGEFLTVVAEHRGHRLAPCDGDQRGEVAVELLEGRDHGRVAEHIHRTSCLVTRNGSSSCLLPEQ